MDFLNGFWQENFCSDSRENNLLMIGVGRLNIYNIPTMRLIVLGDILTFDVLILTTTLQGSYYYFQIIGKVIEMSRD